MAQNRTGPYRGTKSQTPMRNHPPEAEAPRSCAWSPVSFAPGHNTSACCLCLRSRHCSSFIARIRIHSCGFGLYYAFCSTLHPTQKDLSQNSLVWAGARDLDVLWKIDRRVAFCHVTGLKGERSAGAVATVFRRMLWKESDVKSKSDPGEDMRFVV